MATFSHTSSIIPVEVKEPVFDFVSSGLHQIERVLKGPRARQEVHDAIGYQSKGVFFGSDSDEMSYSPPAIQNPKSKHLDIADKLEHSSVARFETLGSALERPGKRLLKPCRQDRGPSLNLESVTNMELAEAEVTQMPLRLVEDTVRHVFAGTAARTMSQALIHPIDTIKTRMQVNKVTAPPLLQAWRQHSKEQTVNVFVGRHRVLKMRHWLVQGPLDLYRGLTCAILGTIPVAMIYFSTYELSKGYMERRGASGTTSHLASASMGAVMSAFVRVPTDTLRHQTQAYLIPNFIQGAQSIVAARGVRGLYNGLLPTLLRDVPELTLQFQLYESLRFAMQHRGKVKKLQTWQHLVLGALSGGLAATATMPLDVTKTALQCGNGTSVSSILSTIVKEKGVAGLFAGMGPRVAQISLQGAVFFTLFEAWKAQLKPGPMRIGDDRFIQPKLWRKRRGHVWKRQFVFQ